jgi:hypothetical protein
VGTVELHMNFKAIDKGLLQPDWAKNLRVSSMLENKYEFFNDNLANEFKDDCQFGKLYVSLRSLYIPMMSMDLKKTEDFT